MNIWRDMYVYTVYLGYQINVLTMNNIQLIKCLENFIVIFKQIKYVQEKLPKVVFIIRNRWKFRVDVSKI